VKSKCRELKQFLARYTQRTSKYDFTVISLCQMQGINLQATYSVSENLQRRRWHKIITVKSYFEVVEYIRNSKQVRHRHIMQGRA
jgi:hypothetical protein